MRSLVLADHLEGFLGNGAHLLGTHLLLQVDHRPHVQGPDGGMGVPGAFGVVLVKHLRQAVGVFGQVFQTHGAILDEGDRFAVPLHGHHDVEARFADLPDVALEGRVHGLDHRVGEAQVGHHLDQLGKLGE